MKIDCTVIGDVCFDVIVTKKHWKRTHLTGGTTYLDSAVLVAGGAGNVAVGMSLLGLHTAMIGKAGNDFLGKQYQENLMSANVDAHLFFDQNASTGTVVSLTETNGERSFLVFKGANNHLSCHEIEVERELIGNSKYLYVCGFSLASLMQQKSILTAIEIAKSNNVKIIFDPGAFNLVRKKRALFERILSMSDVFCPNLKEALAITNTKTLENVIEQLRGETVLSAIKLGEDGSVIVSNGETVRCPAFPVLPVDSTGAGDAYVAALLFGVLKGFSLQRIACFANWYSSAILKACGARCYPPEEEVSAFLNKLDINLNEKGLIC